MAKATAFAIKSPKNDVIRLWRRTSQMALIIIFTGIMSVNCKLLLWTAILLLLNCGKDSDEKDTIFQLSTLEALQRGDFDGLETLGSLKQYGDIGLGTFHALDGEMIYLDGNFYQVRTDGIAHAVADSLITPFIDITHFEADLSNDLDQALGFEELTDYLDDINSGNSSYSAIKIHGAFNQLTTRSVDPQMRPYPTLTDALSQQVTFDYLNVNGTMVGFHLPVEVEGVGIPGYHFHFISDDRFFGGHVLSLQIGAVKIEIDYSNKLELID